MKGPAMLKLAHTLALLLVIGVPSLAAAIPVTLNFNGTVDFVQTVLPSEVSGLSVGDSIDITLAYESTTQVGTLSALGPGGQSIATTGPLFLSVINDFPSVGDVFTASGTGISMLEFFAVDPTGTATSSTALPTSAADLAGYQGFSFRYFLPGAPDPFGGPPEPDIEWFTAVGSINAVPEPSTALLVMLGLGVLSGRRVK